MAWNHQRQANLNTNAHAYVRQQNNQYASSPQQPQSQQYRDYTRQEGAGMQNDYAGSYGNTVTAHGYPASGPMQHDAEYPGNTNNDSNANATRVYVPGGYVPYQSMQSQGYVPNQDYPSRSPQHQQHGGFRPDTYHSYGGALNNNNNNNNSMTTDSRYGPGTNRGYENAGRRGRQDAMSAASSMPAPPQQQQQQQQQSFSPYSSPSSPSAANSAIDTGINSAPSAPNTGVTSAAPAKRKGGATLFLGASKPVTTALKTDENDATAVGSQISSPNTMTETEAGKTTNEETQLKEAVAAGKTNDSVNNNSSGKSIAASTASNTTASPVTKVSTDTMREAVRKEIAKQRDQSKKQFVRDPRPHFNVVFCGHVDAGKSTISGHLLMEKGLVDQREMDKLRREAEIHHREGWEYAYVMDVSEEERSKGITRETGAAYFETEKRRVTVLDAPGHKAFVPSMIGGATQADICVLVISSRTGEFETGFEKGGQTREHAMLVRTCGVKQMICVINKMDEMKWSKDRYDQIVGKLKPFLRQNGYDEERAKNLIFIPVAGLTGDNLIKPTKSEVCPWYNGPTMMDVIDELKLPETRSEHDALCIPLVGSYKDDGKTFVYGKVESGSIAVGEKIQILPNKQDGIVEGISIEATEFEKCYPGDNVHLRVRGIDESDVHAGYVATSIPTTLRAVEFFQARVVILDVRNILSAGSRFMLHIHSAQEEATLGKLFAKLDKKTGQIIERDPACVRAGDAVIARIDLHLPLVCEAHKDFDKMGRFMLRDDGKTIAIGLITKLYESTRDNIIKKAA